MQFLFPPMQFFLFPSPEDVPLRCNVVGISYEKSGWLLRSIETDGLVENIILLKNLIFLSTEIDFILLAQKNVFIPPKAHCFGK